MLQDFLDFLFPRNCACCERLLVANEQVICTPCRNDLPLTDFHLSNDNPIKKLFYGRVPIENAMSLLIFQKKGITQALMHSLKYKGNEEVGIVLGAWIALNLRQTSWHSEIDMVVPVPLHRKRLRERGYNQVEGFGKAISRKLKIPYNDKCLLKTSAVETQVFKNLAARFKNVEHSFRITEKQKERKKLEGKHLLLVDDIITTGATLETCAHCLLEIPGTKVSVATMATTR